MLHPKNASQPMREEMEVIVFSHWLLGNFLDETDQTYLLQFSLAKVFSKNS